MVGVDQPMYIQKPLSIIKGNNSHRIGPMPLFFFINICHVNMNMFARFDKIPSMALQDNINKDTKSY